MNPLFARITAAALLVASACKHVPSEKELQGAQIHYDLGVQAQQDDPQQAFKEFEAALALDPDFAEAHNAIAVVLHLAFRRFDEAAGHYQRAIAIRPTFSEAKTNLANVYLDQKRYDEAIALYEEALNDMLYPTPFIAHGNLGWALYKKGEVKKGLDHIKAAVTTNPKFCLGYKNLGLIHDEQGAADEACRQFAKYRENCPEVAEAHYREGVCLAKLGQVETAKERLTECVSKTTSDQLRDDCESLKQKLE
ncbi:MAG: social motility TPR repeat lipoprotein Tgl [Myxococcota bacterium]